MASFENAPSIFLVLAVLSGLCALLYPFLHRVSWPRSVVKTVAVGALALWAYVLGFPILAAALALSALGDLALSRDGERAFLIGMLAFGAAHLLYALMFYWGGLGALGGWETLGIVLIGAAAAWLGPRYAAKAGNLAIPVLVYVSIIALMAALAVMQPHGAGQAITLIGALLFMTSDAILGQEQFLRQTWRGQGGTIWGLYYLAQVCLFIGFVWIGP